MAMLLHSRRIGNEEYLKGDKNGDEALQVLIELNEQEKMIKGKTLNRACGSYLSFSSLCVLQTNRTTAQHSNQEGSRFSFA